MGDWLDLLAVCVNEWMRRKWLKNVLGYNVYIIPHHAYVCASFPSSFSSYVSPFCVHLSLLPSLHRVFLPCGLSKQALVTTFLL